MGTDISSRQRGILDYIRETVADRGYPPSVREIGEAVGLSSPSTVHSHLATLEATGHLRRDPTKPRAIEILGEGSHAANVRNVPLVGRIAAGSPILADEDIEEVYPLPVDLVGDGPIFMLRVKGESMIGAGILDGDFVVVHRQPDALDGEIVAALIDGEEATVKRLARKNGAVILLSENPAFEPMVFNEGVELIGKVVTVLRGIH